MLVGSIPAGDESSDDTIVWQYMDFTKLVSILERKELFFALIDNFILIVLIHHDREKNR
jgi:hypothetical protein